jgi:uncharacterized membrane protein YphA (DoxX/SURF4 family)
MIGPRPLPLPCAEGSFTCKLRVARSGHITKVIQKDSKSGRFAAANLPLLSNLHHRRQDLRRLYSTFPSGFPGGGLLLLRVGMGLILVVQSYRALPGTQSSSYGLWVLALITSVVGISFILGLLTPLAGLVAVLIGPTLQLWHSTWNPYPPGLWSLSPLVMAVAITLLGPGAFSLDARFFGRRKVFVPRANNL